MTKDEQDFTEIWHRFITEGPFLERRMRKVFGRLPNSPRCRWCHAPFEGPGSILMRLVGIRRSSFSPVFCTNCAQIPQKYPGGSEEEISMLFADVRGSTALAERVGAAEFSRLVNRFFSVAGKVMVETNGWADRLVGDQAIGYFLPGYVGPDHAAVAIEAAQRLLHATGHDDPGGPWLPVGAGVHTGVVYFGVVGTDVLSVTALGDAANTAARLSSSAQAGEILVSEAAASAAKLDTAGQEPRTLQLKGRSEPVGVYSLRTAPGPVSAGGV